MSFNFEVILTVLTLITGITFGIDRLYLRKKVKNDDAPKKKNYWLEFADSVFPVLLVVLVIRSFIVEPFRIPSASMHPGLVEGDFILVNKFTYGIKLPAIRTQIIPNNSPERGDVVVFKFPEDPSVDYIKRVIGLPGDTIEYRNKTVYINGKKIKQVERGIYIKQPNSVIRTEDLLGVKHDIVVKPLQGEGPHARRWTVPKGHYFVLGDNRDASSDSRYWRSTNFVPQENLVGKAFFIWMNFGEFSRIGNSID